MCVCVNSLGFFFFYVNNYIIYEGVISSFPVSTPLISFMCLTELARIMRGKQIVSYH